MEDMEASLNNHVDDNIAQCLIMVSTHTDISIRQSYGRCVLRALQQPIDRIVNDVCTVLSTLLVVSEDEEATVRSCLLAELPDIIIKCRELVFDDFCLYDRYLDVMLKFLEDVDPQLRKNAFYAIKQLLEKSILDKPRILGKVCPAIIGLSNLPFKNHDVDYYTNAIELMALLSSLIGQDDTETHLLDRFCDMCENEVYSIRRWCADYMPVLCHVLGQTITEKRLLPIFKLLCEDSVWGVRKSAAKSLPKIALICSLERRRDTLAPIAFNLLNDASRFVSGSAFKNLGQFIATFAQPCVIELEYGSSGKLYITSKANETKSQSSFTEENTLATHRRDESCSMLESTKGNPFRRFLIGEPFSIQSTSHMDLQNLNAQSFHSICSRIVDSSKRDETESSTSFLDKQQDQLNETLCDDDDMPSSSGCSSASSTSGGDDNANSEDIMKTNTSEVDSLMESKDDLNESANKNNKQEEEDEEEYVDDFNDSFPNDILDKLPDGLREVIAQIRETTNIDIRQRNKESRIAMMLTADENRNRRKAELRAKMLGLKPPVITNGPLNPSSVNHSHHSVFDLSKPVKFYPWKLKKKLAYKETTQEPLQPEGNSNVLVIDNTNVTLRKKGTSQINDDYDPSETSRTEDQQPSAESPGSNESDAAAPAIVDELQEFNTHNYWYISPTSIDIEKELWLLKSPEEDDPQQPPPPQDDIQKLSDGHTKMINRVYDMLEIPPANDVFDYVHKQKLDKLKANCIGPMDDPQTSFFNQSIVPPYLIEYFVSMEHFADSDFNMYCVYNFPAVVLTLKKENWHLTYDLLLFLAGDIQWKVRKTIAMFICDIAVIIGRENTHRDLMAIFLGFFKDLDEVKIEALKNLPTFLSVIDIEEHPKVIANLGECLQCDNDSNWRFREELARQLLHLIKTYGRVYRVDYMIWVTGMAIALLTDKVSAVRTVAMDAIAEKFCTSSPLELKYLVEFLVEDFARHVHWRRRQMFVNICQELISKDNAPSFEVIGRSLLPHILELAKDKIPNIRLAVVRLLSLLLSNNPHLLTKMDHPIMETMMTLQCDADNDVKFVAMDRLIDGLIEAI